MKEKEMKRKRLGIIYGTIGAVIIGALVITASVGLLHNPNDDVQTWHKIAVINSYDFVLGENSPGAGASGWLATFCLDYAETPGTCLASNASGGGYDSWGNVSGYVDTDDTDTDLASEDPFYFVVRARFNDTVKDGADFIGSRCRCTLTVSGDETIAGVAQTGDDDGTDNNGGGVCSYNDTGADFIYINFYWDDNSDGYRITDDGSLTWSITLEAKY